MVINMLDLGHFLAILAIFNTSLAYVYEEELYYDTFPDGFAWGVATAAYQVILCQYECTATQFKGHSRSHRTPGATHHLLCVQEASGLSDLVVRRPLVLLLLSIGKTFLFMGKRFRRKQQTFRLLMYNEDFTLLTGEKQRPSG